jgi:NAD(P)-dependent dehydrogenase (short-subunit alcohol dehydrogenase family)
MTFKDRSNVTATQKFALVTGGGSGIGRAAALGLQQAGYAVAIAGRREAELDATAALGVDGPPMLCVPADVRDPESIRSLFARVREVFGRLDVLFNNAGVFGPAVPFEELTYEQWSDVVAVNFTGVFLCAQEAFRLMKSQTPRGGRIINNGSIAAHAPRPHSAPYTSTKHAVLGLTKSISLDGRAHDIACGQIDIGNAITQGTERMAAGILQPDGSLRQEARIDLKPVADAVVYMASLPLDANVQYLTVMATKMPFIGRG